MNNIQVIIIFQLGEEILLAAGGSVVNAEGKVCDKQQTYSVGGVKSCCGVDSRCRRNDAMLRGLYTPASCARNYMDKKRIFFFQH